MRNLYRIVGVIICFTIVPACWIGDVPDAAPPPVPPPVPTGVSVASGPQFGRTDITITGTGFQAGAVVGMRESPSGLFTYTEDVTFVDSTTLQTRTLSSNNVPNTGPTPAEIIVVNPDGQSTRLNGAFTWNASTFLPPKILGVFDPNFPNELSNAGSTAGGETRWIYGMNFHSASVVQSDPNFTPTAGFSVAIGGTPTTVNALGLGYQNFAATNNFAYHLIEIVTPPGLVRPRVISVTNPDGQSVATTWGTFTHVTAPQPFISLITLNGIGISQNGSTFGDGILHVPPSGFSIDLKFENYPPTGAGNSPINGATLLVQADRTVAGIPAGGNLAGLFTLTTLPGKTYPTEATWNVSGAQALTTGKIQFSVQVSNVAGIPSPLTTTGPRYSFVVDNFTATSNPPLPFVQTWYITFQYDPDLRGYGLCTNVLPFSAEEFFVAYALDSYIIKMTRSLFRLDPVTGLPTGLVKEQIPNIRIEYGPPPGPFSTSGTFSHYRIGGNAISAGQAGAVPGVALGFCGNNEHQEDYIAGYTDPCTLAPPAYRVVPPNIYGTYMNSDVGAPLYYVTDPSAAAVFAPLLAAYNAGSNPNGGPVGTHPVDPVVLSPFFNRTSLANTASQNARWDVVIGDPTISGAPRGGAVWSLARQLSTVNAQEIGHSMGLVHSGPLPFGLLGGTNMHFAHYDESFTPYSTPNRFVNVMTYNSLFLFMTNPNTKIGFTPLEIAYLRGTIIRRYAWEQGRPHE